MSQSKKSVDATKTPTIPAEIEDEVKELVMARLKAMPKDFQISVGSEDYSLEELIKRVQKGDELGRKIMELQLKYLRDLGSGEIHQYLENE